MKSQNETLYTKPRQNSHIYHEKQNLIITTQSMANETHSYYEK